MPTLMTCARRYTLRTTAGHVIRFEPDTPVSVPDSVVHEALAVNILPVEGTVAEAETNVNAPVKANIDGLLRDAVVLRCIDDLVRENDTANFDAGGRPKTAIVNNLTGLSLNATERNKYWDRWRAIKAAEEELPRHKALETVLEIQYLSTPKDMKEYAAALDVPDSDLKGRPLREQKQILLAAAIKAA